MELERNFFDRDLAAKLMTATLDNATSGVLAGIKAVSLAHEQSLRSATILLEQAESVANQNRQMSEELVSNVKKYTTDLQKLYLDAWGQWADKLKPAEVAATAEKKKA